MPSIGPGSNPCSLRRVCTMRTSRSEEHTSELQSRLHLVCRLLLEKKKILSPTAEYLTYTILMPQTMVVFTEKLGSLTLTICSILMLRFQEPQFSNPSHRAHLARPM